MSPLEEKLSYCFKDPKLLETALTHSSFLNEHDLPKNACNERLEFLGDAILEKETSAFLFQVFPEAMEGRLSRMRAALVCEEALAQCARKLDLGSALFLGKGMEKSGGRESDAIISDAFEALIAALYLDGGSEVSAAFIKKYVLADYEERLVLHDAKTYLQEEVQKNGHVIRYELISESGPQHSPVFCSAVLMDGEKISEGTGNSKKQAEQQAAAAMLRLIKEHRICI